jgi:hypothetical protein
MRCHCLEYDALFVVIMNGTGRNVQAASEHVSFNHHHYYGDGALSIQHCGTSPTLNHALIWCPQSGWRIYEYL